MDNLKTELFKVLVASVIFISLLWIIQPINAQSCSPSIEFFTSDPASPVSLGTHVNLHGKGNCGTSKFEINGQSRAEIALPEQTETWRTEEFGAGTYNVCYLLRGDGGWENADRSCKAYEVIDGAPPPTPLPPPPVNPACSIEFFNISPSSPVIPGTWIEMHGRGNCGTSRLTLNGNSVSEFAGSEITERVELIGLGDYQVCYWLRGDGGWENADRQCQTYTVSHNTSAPSTPPTEAPISPLPTAGGSTDCQVDSFSVSPEQGQSGTTFTFSGSGNCTPNVRAVRFLVDGVPFGEFGGPSHTTSWGSSGYSDGQHTIGFQVVYGDWSQSATSYITITLGNGSNSSPDNPVDVSAEPTIAPLLHCRTDFTNLGNNYLQVNSSIGVNVRAGAGTNYAILGRVENGCYLAISGTPELGNQGATWHQIQLNSGIGWIHGAYVQITLLDNLPINVETAIPNTEVWEEIYADETDLTALCFDPFGSATIRFSIYGNFQWEGMQLKSMSAWGNSMALTSVVYNNWEEYLDNTRVQVVLMAVECRYVLVASTIYPILAVNQLNQPENWILRYRVD